MSMATRKKSTDQPTSEPASQLTRPADQAPEVAAPVALRWIGHNGERIGVRTFGAYQWDKSNDYTQLVAELEVIEDLLTNGDFELVEDNN